MSTRPVRSVICTVSKASSCEVMLIVPVEGFGNILTAPFRLCNEEANPVTVKLITIDVSDHSHWPRQQ